MVGLLKGNMKNKTFIVAEIGVNHNGKIEIAERLIDIAEKVGADAVKFQCWGINTFPELNFLRLGFPELNHLKMLTAGKNIIWFCTPFDFAAVKFLSSINNPIWKIPSNKAVWNNYDLMNEIVKASKGKPIFISLGISSVRQIENFIPDFINREAVLFHCVSNYPTLPENANFRKLKSLIEYRDENGFSYSVGFSDHSGLPEMPVVAVGLGARFIECHLTFDKNAEGADHRSSLDPEEFASMVKMIRNVEKGL